MSLWCRKTTDCYCGYHLLHFLHFGETTTSSKRVVNAITASELIIGGHISNEDKITRIGEIFGPKSSFESTLKTKIQETVLLSYFHSFWFRFTGMRLTLPLLLHKYFAPSKSRCCVLKAMHYSCCVAFTSYLNAKSWLTKFWLSATPHSKMVRSNSPTFWFIFTWKASNSFTRLITLSWNKSQGT